MAPKKSAASGKAKSSGKAKPSGKASKPAAANTSAKVGGKKGKVAKKPAPPRKMTARQSMIARGVKPAVKGAALAEEAAATKKRATRATKATATAPAASKKPTKAAAAPKKPAAAPKKTVAATKKSAAAPKKAPTTTTRKRKAAGETANEDEPAQAGEPSTSPKAAAKDRPTKRAKVVPRAVINETPTQKLDVYVCGEGSSGELGLGTAKLAIDVKRPRLNHLLAASTVGVVQIAAGGMHVVALTHDNKILTWGVNDQGALGRSTDWDGGLRDMDDDASDKSDDSDDDNGLNPREAFPTAIPEDEFPEGTRFVHVAAADSASFAVTDQGLVYGWGTFRSNEGVFGFTKEILVQRTPILIPQLKKITSVACGANHCLALDVNGNVFAWGSGQQNQLGRRVIERTKTEGLVPREFGLPKKQIHSVACGAYHSFAIDKTGNVLAWGLNNYGETGIPDNAGDENAVVLKPAKVEELADYKMKVVSGGAHHSIGVTEDGDCLVWGRIDGDQIGIEVSKIPEESILRDEHDRPRILKVPTKVPNIHDAVYATCGSDHSLAVTKDGKVYSWGFSANYQTGQGVHDDVQLATVINNTAIRGKPISWVGAGGQYSIFCAVAGETVPVATNVPVAPAVTNGSAVNSAGNADQPAVGLAGALNGTALGSAHDGSVANGVEVTNGTAVRSTEMVNGTAVSSTEVVNGTAVKSTKVTVDAASNVVTK